MASLTHKALNWTEDKLVELDGSKKSDLVKAFGIGAIEGTIDSALIIGMTVLIKGWINIFTKNK